MMWKKIISVVTNPTLNPEDKNDQVIQLVRTYPCKTCREHFQEFQRKKGILYNEGQIRDYVPKKKKEYVKKNKYL